MKKCSKCGIEKELSEFYKIVNYKDGLDTICKCCRKEEFKKYHNKNKDIIKQKHKENYSKNKEKIATQQKQPINKFKKYKFNAKDRGYSFELTFEQFEQLIKQPCHYCGKDGLNGVDRKDNTQGYILDNCLPCCSVCNKAKLDRTYDEFISWIKTIYNRFV